MELLRKLNQEYNDIDSKIRKLDKALISVPLDNVERGLLISQREHMKGYRDVLNRRIIYTEKKYSRL